MAISNTPKIRLYGLVTYDRSAKVRWLLTELGVPFETQWLNRSKKENESPEFLRLNPMGRVPVLTVDDQAVFESGAICTYLGDLFQSKGMAPSLNSPERAEYLQWIHFATTLDVFQIRIMVIEDIPAGEVQTTKQTALKADLRDAMQALDRTLARSSFLVGNRFTTADIGVSYHLYWLRMWPELDEVIKDFPNVIHFLDRMKATPSAIKAEVFSYES